MTIKKIIELTNNLDIYNYKYEIIKTANYNEYTLIKIKEVTEIKISELKELTITFKDGTNFYIDLDKTIEIYTDATQEALFLLIRKQLS